jgi:hypothetical protein
MLNRDMNEAQVLNALIRKHRVRTYWQIGGTEEILNAVKLSEFKKRQSSDGSLVQASATAIDKFDLIFIDGNHHIIEARKDFNNALKMVARKRMIVLHDSNPKKYLHTVEGMGSTYCGQVWQLVCELRTDDRYSIVTLDIGTGYTIVRCQKTNDILTSRLNIFGNFVNRRSKCLNLIDPANYETWFTNWTKYGSKPIEDVTLVETVKD